MLVNLQYMISSQTEMQSFILHNNGASFMTNFKSYNPFKIYTESYSESLRGQLWY